MRLHNDDFGYESNCFVCEPANDRGLQIPFFHDTERGVVTSEFSLSNDFSGAPTMVHGGVILAVLDEAMAWACIAVGRQWAVTTETTTRFNRAVRIDTTHTIEAEIIEQNGDQINTRARILDLKGRARAEATASFTILGEVQLKRAVGIGANEEIAPSLTLD